MELRKITRKELLKRYAAGDRDFSGVDLSGMMIVNHFRFIDLSGIDLSGIDLSGSNLDGINFSGANLSGANLSRIGAVGFRYLNPTYAGLHLLDHLCIKRAYAFFLSTS